MHYNLYSFLRINLNSEINSYIKYFNNEYERIHKLYKDSVKQTISITIHIASRLPAKKPNDIELQSVFKKIFCFSYILRGFGTNNVHIYFKRHFVDRIYTTITCLFLQTHILEPIIYMKLLEEGVLLMHCAGVADQHYGYIFPAYGGTGKTTLSLNLVREGFKLLGDDLLLLDSRNKHAYAYPRPLHLFLYNINSLKGAHIPFTIKARVFLKHVLRLLLEKITGQEFLISTRAHVDQIYSDVKFSNPVIYRKIIFLKKDGENNQVFLTNRTSEKKVINAIIDCADLNKNLYRNILRKNRVLIAKTRFLEAEVVKKVLKEIKCVDFVNAHKIQDFSLFTDYLRS